MLRSALVVFLSGCGFLADPQIKSVEINENQGGNLTITVIEFDYASGGKLKSMKVTEAQVPQFVREFDYSGERIDSFTDIPEGAATGTTWSFDYKDDRVTEVIEDDGTGTTDTTTMDYDSNDRLEKVTENADDADPANHDVTTYEYDDEGRLERRLRESGGNATDTTFKYEENEGFGELKSLSIAAGGTPISISFKYDEARRLERVSSGGESESIKYNDDGLVEEIKEGTGNNTTTTKIEYTDDNGVAGIDARLPVTAGDLFTLDGRRIDRLDPLGEFVFDD